MCVLKKMGVLIDGVTETIKHEMKKQEGGFLDALITPLAASLVQPMIFSVVKGISGRELNNIKITKYFYYEHRFNDVFSSYNLPGIKDGANVINLDDKIE